MAVRFIKLFKGDDALDYLQAKWRSASKLGAAEVFERALDAQRALREGPVLPLRGVAALPDHDDGHRKVAGEIADSMMPLLADEHLAQPDSFDVLAEDAAGFPGGTLLLRRVTNLSEAVYFFPCTNVVSGVLHRGQAHDEAHERVLSHGLRGVLSRDASPGAPPEVAVLVEPITMSLIASTIALGILSGAASKVGSLAITYALGALGIKDPGGHAGVDYDRLVEALKLQSRADFRQRITGDLNAFHRGVVDYNNGARSLPGIQRLYDEIRRIAGYLEAGDREVDRVHLLAYVQGQYLAIQQEMAEWHRKDNPELMKSFYESMVKRAAAEAVALGRMRDQAIGERLAKVTGVHKRPHEILSDYWVCSFADVVPPTTGRSWELYNVRCTRHEWRNGPGGPYPVCVEWAPTSKGQDTLNDMQKRMDGHRAWVHGVTSAALSSIPKTIEELRKVSQMTIPPPPPR